MHYLLALVVITLSHVKFTVLISVAPQDLTAPDFWWDLTLDRNALISYMIFPPLTSDVIDKIGQDFASQESDWDLRFAHGSSLQWLAGGHGFWSIWNWNSSQNEDITGGGFIFNETKLGVAAGMNWLNNAHSDAIIWNCFVEGNIAGPLPWDDWNMKLEDYTEMGFKKDQSRFGFMTGDHTVMSKHCATGNPVVGKRYRYMNGREVDSSVKNDPFKTVERPKRSPGTWEKITQTFKSWMQKIKNFFSPGEQNEDDGQETPEDREGGKKCNTVLDLMVRIIDFILGRNRRPEEAPEGRPSIPQPPGGIPQGPNGEIPESDIGGGDPPGGAVSPPADAEELDLSQNDAVRDWE